MFDKREDQFQAAFLDEHGKAEVKTTYITDKEDARFDVQGLKKSVIDMLKDETRKPDLEKIFAFGAGFVEDNNQAHGFLVAWIVLKLWSQYEKDNDTELTLNIEKEELTKSEVREYAIGILKGHIKLLEQDDDSEVKRLPSSPIDNLDGTF